MSDSDAGAPGMLRLLHVTPYSEEAWGYGGIPRLLGTLTRELARRGHLVTVCATDACDGTRRLAGRSARYCTRPPVTSPDGVELRIFPNLSNRLAYGWQAYLPLGLASYLRRHAGGFDAAHLHACRNVPGVLASQYLRRARVPFVLAPNGTAPRIERRRLAKLAFDLAAGGRLVRRATRVLAVSEAERRQLRMLDVEDDRIRVIPNPVDLDEFDPAIPVGRFRQRLGLGPAPIVLYLGQLSPRKRLDVVVRAFAESARPDARLVIAGNDMGAEAATRSLAGALGVAERTLLTGLLRGRDRLEALADADVVVYPGAHEVFGLVAVEALLAGTPVVVADDSGCGEIVRSTGGGRIVPQGDAGAAARAIADVLESPEGWRVEAGRAGARVRATYGGPAIAARIETLYEEIADVGRQRAPRAVVTARPTAAPARLEGVSFVVPVRNGARWLRDTMAAIAAQADGRPLEIIAIDDRSEDRSATILKELAGTLPLRVLQGAGRGAAAAINLGIRASRHPIICQVDQDVVIGPGWLRRLTAEFDDPTVAAAQGQYMPDPAAPLVSRVMAVDLAQRYASIRGRFTGHVCTGNATYRASALERVGPFDERLGYGYDNDMSYRLREAGYRLAFCRDAPSRHQWRETLRGYCVQQYGFGYGRVELVAKHPRRATGDSVSPASMMIHPVAMGLAAALLAAAGVLAAARGPWALPAACGAALVVLLGLERLAAGIAAARRFREPSALLFPVFHLVRDAVWVGAVAVWSVRRLHGRTPGPSASMRPRPVDRREPVRLPAAALGSPPASRVLGLIPAYNEAAALPGVVAETRAAHPDLDLLVIDDGSTDGTASIVERLDVRCVRLPERAGVGRAMRAGLRYAARLGYDTIVRLDGDGQHRPEEIDVLLDPIRRGRADVVLGSRFVRSADRTSVRLTGTDLADPSSVHPTDGHTSVRPTYRLLRRALAVCLSTLTGRRVTDPTSGFCALGPRAVRLLAEHHPTGYPEAELRLLLSRSGLTVVEVPVRARPRQGGRTSLTAGRLTAAGARVLLAMIVVPLRGAAGSDRG